MGGGEAARREVWARVELAALNRFLLAAAQVCPLSATQPRGRRPKRVVSPQAKLGAPLRLCVAHNAAVALLAANEELRLFFSLPARDF